PNNTANDRGNGSAPGRVGSPSTPWPDWSRMALVPLGASVAVRSAALTAEVNRQVRVVVPDPLKAETVGRPAPLKARLAALPVTGSLKTTWMPVTCHGSTRDGCVSRSNDRPLPYSTRNDTTVGASSSAAGPGSSTTSS